MTQREKMHFWQTRDRALPVYGVVPDFTLTERSGKKISLADLKNKAWVADFIFTRCAGQCPLMSQAMSRLEKDLKNLCFVSFSVDPDYDTPPILTRYAQSYGADPERWLFLTGEKKALNTVSKGFHVNGTEEPLFHSVVFALVDQKGQIRGYYDATDAQKIKQLSKDTHALLI